MTLKTLLLIGVVSLSASAQPIGVGIKGGVPFTDLFKGSGNFQTQTKRYIIGPMVELRLPMGISIEGDALYSRADFTSVTGAASSLVTSAFDTNAWEFPVVLKYKFGGSSVGVAAARPYVEAGASFRKLTGLSNLPAFLTNGNGVDKNNTGFVIGGGVDIRALFLHISPEVRFTHWGTEHFTSGIANIWQTNRNQGQFLIGISF